MYIYKQVTKLKSNSRSELNFASKNFAHGQI